MDLKIGDLVQIKNNHWSLKKEFGIIIDILELHSGTGYYVHWTHGHVGWLPKGYDLEVVNENR
jgi:hypothetical protein